MQLIGGCEIGSFAIDWAPSGRVSTSPSSSGVALYPRNPWLDDETRSNAMVTIDGAEPPMTAVLRPSDLNQDQPLSWRAERRLNELSDRPGVVNRSQDRYTISGRLGQIISFEHDVDGVRVRDVVLMFDAYKTMELHISGPASRSDYNDAVLAAIKSVAVMTSRRRVGG